MTTLAVGLFSWILLDGSYENVLFEVGQRVRFAVEFGFASCSISDRPLSLVSVAGRPSFYNATAQVIYCNESCRVIDLGVISAFQLRPSDLKLGQFVKGELSLSVDSSDYYEGLNKLGGIPPLIYEWHIERIEMDLTPLLLVLGSDGRKEQKRSEKEIYRAVDRINLAEDKVAGCNGKYVLHCVKMPTLPSASFE